MEIFGILFLKNCILLKNMGAKLQINGGNAKEK
jgi:hypothetical protein